VFELVTFEIGYGTRIVLAGDHTAKLARDRKVREHQNASDAYQSNGGRMAGNVCAQPGWYSRCIFRAVRVDLAECSLLLISGKTPVCDQPRAAPDSNVQRFMTQTGHTQFAAAVVR
jgi:hypothetical protein